MEACRRAVAGAHPLTASPVSPQQPRVVIKKQEKKGNSSRVEGVSVEEHEGKYKGIDEENKRVLKSIYMATH